MSAAKNVVVIGAGPAGIAAAIAANLRGLRSVVLDARLPPVDKACGEGILPHGVAALRKLGIHLDATIAHPFHGIRFLDEESSACADFAGEPGFALRRPRLQQLLMERAAAVGVEFQWGVRVIHVDSKCFATDEKQIPYDWLIGADGQNSAVRDWAGLHSSAVRRERFGFRRHFRVRPWADGVEVYWGEGAQMFVTPTGEEEVGVAVFSRDPQLRVEQALDRFPALAEKLQDAPPASKELSDTTTLRRLPEVTVGCIARAGDASGTVDALTGHGLSMAFEQAVALAEALHRENLPLYEAAHRKIAAIPVAMTRLMLLMEGSATIRRKALRMFQESPGLFTRLLSIHSGSLPLSSVSAGEVIEFGWKLMRA
jgi:flavin-dependent dehydrogenase